MSKIALAALWLAATVAAGPAVAQATSPTLSRIKAAKATIFGSGCTSWYLDKTGVPITWPWDYDAFDDAMAKPDFDAFEMV